MNHVWPALCLALTACTANPMPAGPSSDQQKAELRARLNDWFVRESRLRCEPYLFSERGTVAQAMLANAKCEAALDADYHRTESEWGLPYQGMSSPAQAAPPPVMTAPTDTMCWRSFGGVQCSSH